MMVKSSPVLGYLFPDSPIFHDTRHKSFAVLLIFKLPDPGNRQHFTLSIWFQNTHMSQCLIRENYIRRHLLLSGDLQAKHSQYLKKLLLCLCKLCTGQMGSGAFSVLFLFLFPGLTFLFLCHFHSDLCLIIQHFL